MNAIAFKLLDSLKAWSLLRGNHMTTNEIREYTERAAVRIGLALKDNGRNLLYRKAGAWHSFDPAHNDADSRFLARRLRMLVNIEDTAVFAYAFNEISNTEHTEYLPPNATLAEIGAAERLAVLRVAGAE